jgi:hypothetical protein
MKEVVPSPHPRKNKKINENKECKNIITLRENVINFKFFLHSIDHKTCGS